MPADQSIQLNGLELPSANRALGRSAGCAGSSSGDPPSITWAAWEGSCRSARSDERDLAAAVPARPGVADIIDLIVADHRRIQRLEGALYGASHHCSRHGSAWLLASAWARLADLIDLHLSARDEICLPAMCSDDVQGLEMWRDAVADHDDINGAIEESGLQPAGSAPWWRAVTDAVSGCQATCRTQEQNRLPQFAVRADDRQRRRLGEQWHAYRTARLRDRHG